MLSWGILAFGTPLSQVQVRFQEPRSRGYSITIEPGLIDKAGARLRPAFKGYSPFIISSPRVWALWGARLSASLRRVGFKAAKPHLVPDGERHKNLGSYQRSLAALAAFGKGGSVKPLGLALGGGVIGDLGGFSFASYKRGIPFVQLPTTLLAMVDSSVGGKLGVDLKTPRGVIKNLVGAFYQPAAVLIDPQALGTLPGRELRAGLAEVVKTAVLFDPPLFEALEGAVSRLLAAEPRALSAVIRACVAHKARVVMADEFDRHGKRALLNLGHTFGHAVEAASGFRLLHGEAVAFGLACACDLALGLKVAPTSQRAQLARVPALLEKLGLPTRLPRLPIRKVLEAMAEDKKFEATPRFVLPTRLGRSALKELKGLQPAARVLRARFD